MPQVWDFRATQSMRKLASTIISPGTNFFIFRLAGYPALSTENTILDKWRLVVGKIDMSPLSHCTYVPR